LGKEKIMENMTFLGGELLQPALIAGVVAFVVAVLLVITKHKHGHLSMDTQIGVQKFHTDPTPRIGGLAIACGAVAGYGFAPDSLQDLLGPLLLAGIPAFAFGLLEDVTKRVSVRTRLLATMFCGVLGWAITGYAITRANVPGLDWMLGFTMVSVAFTAFAVGGVANAINIIDGFNGLAAGSVIIIFSGFAAICMSVGDTDLAYVCLLLAGSVVGFLLVNWPLGKIFLGDGGAYAVGFALAWVAVLILVRHPEVSAWAPLLVCGYPILEVGFSILRRRRRGLSPGDPDRLHLHSLVKKRFVRHIFPRASNLIRNSVTGMIMWGAALVPMTIAVLLSGDSLELALGLLLCAFAYSALYARLTQFRWCFRAATLSALARV
jgi:UDP-N-acetylmuramyl pentapeptide phosphotransferase/UDP-N-acetylglucosamine-1-phosphate transferase